MRSADKDSPVLPRNEPTEWRDVRAEGHGYSYNQLCDLVKPERAALINLDSECFPVRNRASLLVRRLFTSPLVAGMMSWGEFAGRSLRRGPGSWRLGCISNVAAPFPHFALLAGCMLRAAWRPGSSSGASGGGAKFVLKGLTLASCQDLRQGLPFGLLPE